LSGCTWVALTDSTWQAQRHATGMTEFAAILNLNHHASYVHWHFLQMSVSNVVVIVLTLVVFAVAILAPFPRHGKSGGLS
jgi:hypothetical protein